MEYSVANAYENEHFNIDISEHGETIWAHLNVKGSPTKTSMKEVKEACKHIIKWLYFEGHEYLYVGTHKKTLPSVLTKTKAEVLREEGDVTIMRVKIEDSYNVYWC